MSSHILVPLDQSQLAECVLPHLLRIAPLIHARVTLLHVLEPPLETSSRQLAAPQEWHLRKQEAQQYLDLISRRLSHNAILSLSAVVLEGDPAGCLVDYAKENDATLIILSTHGNGGLSRWNVSSTAQKIIQNAYTSTLLVRAQKKVVQDAPYAYTQLFVALDGSARAEYILPFAVNLARANNASLQIGIIIPKPHLLGRFSPSEQEAALVNRLVERNRCAVLAYFESLKEQLTSQGVQVEPHLAVCESVRAGLHEMVEQLAPDLVLMVAHGDSNQTTLAFGSVPASFITHGKVSCLILQDISARSPQGGNG